jgi:transposase
MIDVGIDWAEDDHQVCILDFDGNTLEEFAIRDGAAGTGQFHERIAHHVDEPDQVVIGIETDRGLLVGALVAAGYQVCAVNPMSVDRYRDRHATSGGKSDRGDAKVLADLVRTDRHNHRTVAADSELLAAIKVTARTHQNLIWTRTRHSNQLRSALREYYPAALEAFDELTHRDALAILAIAPPRIRAGSCRPPRSVRRSNGPAGNETSTPAPTRSATRCAANSSKRHRSWRPRSVTPSPRSCRCCRPCRNRSAGSRPP